MQFPTKNQEISEEIYNQFKNMLYKEAHRMARVCGLDMEDLAGQAKLIFCEAVRSYNPQMGTQFSTHLGNQLKRLSHYAVPEMNFRSRYISENLQTGTDENCKTLTDYFGAEDEKLRDFGLVRGLAALPDDAHELALLCLAGELENPSKKTNRARRGVTKLGAFQRKTKTMGWDWARHKEAWADLEEHLQGVRNHEPAFMAK